jgi:hypothetical protein
MKLLQVAVLAFCFGFGVLYLVGAMHLVVDTLVVLVALCTAVCNQQVWRP